MYLGTILRLSKRVTRLSNNAIRAAHAEIRRGGDEVPFNHVSQWHCETELGVEILLQVAKVWQLPSERVE